MSADHFDELDDLSQFTVVFIRDCPSLKHHHANALSTADAISDRVRDDWGGQEVYFRSTSQLPLMDDVKQNAGDRFLVELQATVSAAFLNHGLTEPAAEDLARKYISQFHTLVYGQQIYIRKVKETFYRSRDEEIFHRFTGRNHLDLCREYGFTMQRLRQIIRSVSTRRRAR